MIASFNQTALFVLMVSSGARTDGDEPFLNIEAGAEVGWPTTIVHVGIKCLGIGAIGSVGVVPRQRIEVVVFNRRQARAGADFTQVAEAACGQGCRLGTTGKRQGSGS